MAEMEATHTQICQACCYLKSHNFTAPLCTWETAQYKHSINSLPNQKSKTGPSHPGGDQTGHTAGHTWGLMESLELCQLLNTCPRKVDVHLAALHTATLPAEDRETGTWMDF